MIIQLYRLRNFWERLFGSEILHSRQLVTTLLHNYYCACERLCKRHFIHSPHTRVRTALQIVLLFQRETFRKLGVERSTCRSHCVYVLRMFGENGRRRLFYDVRFNRNRKRCTESFFRMLPPEITLSSLEESQFDGQIVTAFSRAIVITTGHTSGHNCLLRYSKQYEPGKRLDEQFRKENGLEVFGRVENHDDVFCFLWAVSLNIC